MKKLIIYSAIFLSIILFAGKSQAITSSSLLSDYMQFKAAERCDHKKDFQRAKAEYLKLADYPDSILQAKAYFRIGKILSAGRDYSGAVDYFGKINGLEYSSVPKDAALLEQGKCYETLGKYEEASRCYSEINTYYPESEYLAEAQKRMNNIGFVPETFTAQELFDRGIDLSKKGAYSKAAENFRALIMSYPDEKISWDAMVKMGVCNYKSGNIRSAIEVLEKCKEFAPEANYYLGFSYWKTGNNAEAFNCFKRLFSISPQSDLESNVRYQLAKYYGQIGASSLSQMLYYDLIRRFPSTDAASNAVWDLGYNLYRSGNYKEAYSVLGKVSENCEDRMAAKCLYWQAKSAEKIGLKIEAAEINRKIADNYTFTYYGVRARNKTASVATRIDLTVNRYYVLNDISGFDNIHYSKFRELFKCGMIREAEDEARAVIQQDPSERGQKVGKICLALALNEEKKYSVSINGIDDEFLSASRADEMSEIEKVALNVLYPKVYEQQVLKSSKKFGVDPYLMFALIREESRFNPDAVSRTHARGLTQIMPRTGRGIARTLKVRPYRAAHLFNPSVNIKMGTYYISKLLERFGGNKYLALASYNGGAGNVSKWLKETGIDDIDEFVENIPLKETRSYVKKVLESYWQYKRIYEGS